jgi:hypothetical protein
VHEQSVPIFQQLARGHPSCCDDVRAIPAVTSQRRGLLAERGIDVSHETVRFWWNRFGPMFAAEIRKRRLAHMRGYPRRRWHLDEVCYLWRAVDDQGEVLEGCPPRSPRVRDTETQTLTIVDDATLHPTALDRRCRMFHFCSHGSRDIGRGAQRGVEGAHALRQRLPSGNAIDVEVRLSQAA